MLKPLFYYIVLVCFVVLKLLVFYFVFCPFRTLGRHGSNHSKNRDKISALELGVSSSEVVKDATDKIKAGWQIATAPFTLLRILGLAPKMRIQ